MRKRLINLWIVVFWAAILLSILSSSRVPATSALMLWQKWSLFAGRSPDPNRFSTWRMQALVSLSSGETVEWLEPGMPGEGGLQRERFRNLFRQPALLRDPRFQLRIARYLAGLYRSGVARPVKIELRAQLVPALPGPPIGEERFKRVLSESDWQ